MIFIEGFDGPGSVAALATKYNFTSTTGVFLGDPLTGAGKSLRSDGTHTADNYVTISLDSNLVTIYFSLKFLFTKTVGSFSNTVPIVNFRDATTSQTTISLINANSLEFRRGATTLASVSVSPDVVYSLRGYMTVNNSTGRAVAILNGVQFCDFTGDTQNSSNAYTNGVQLCTFEYVGAGAHTILHYDHLVLADFPLPDCRVDPLRPVEDGNYAQFTTSTGSSHYALVDETTLDTADYNSSSTSGHRDSFKFAEPTFSGDILGIAVEAYVDKSDSGARAVREFIRQGGTDYDGSADRTLSQSGNIMSAYYEDNPATSNPFTVSELTGASRTEFGIKVQS